MRVERLLGSSSAGVPDGEQPLGGFRLNEFVANFDVLVESARGLPSIRRLILELAIRGRLLPVGADTPTVEGGSPGLAPTPRHWSVATLGDLAEIVRGVTFPADAKGKQPSPGRVACLRTTNVQNTIEWDDLLYIPKTFVARDEQWAREGDLCISMANSYELVGKVAQLGRPPVQATFGGFLAMIRARRGLLPAYLALFMRSPTVQAELRRGATQTTNIANISLGRLRPLPVSMPPLAEQKRIVAKVDQLMALCDELEGRQTKKRETGTRLTKSALEALTTAEDPEAFDAAWTRVVENFDVLIGGVEQVARLRAAIVELAVRGHLEAQRHEDESADALLVRIDAERRGASVKPWTLTPPGPDSVPFPIPPTWRWTHWGRLVLGADSGWSPQCESRPRVAEGWGVVKVSAVSWDRFLSEENKALPAGVAPRPACAIRRGDFLMSRANTSELVGRSVVVSEDPAALMMSDKIVRFAFSSHVDPHFINLYNKTTAARAHYIAKASGTSDSMKNLSREVILALPVPLPPLSEQHRIVARVQGLLAICDDLEANFRRAEVHAGKFVDAAVRELVGELARRHAPWAVV